MNNPIDILLARITKDAPAPWTTQYHYEHKEHVYYVLDANGDEVFRRETYSGDGDVISLEQDAILALVELVNLKR